MNGFLKLSQRLLFILNLFIKTFWAVESSSHEIICLFFFEFILVQFLSLWWLHVSTYLSPLSLVIMFSCVIIGIFHFYILKVINILLVYHWSPSLFKMLMFFEKHLPWVNKITKAVMDLVTVAAILNIIIVTIY